MFARTAETPSMPINNAAKSCPSEYQNLLRMSARSIIAARNASKLPIARSAPFDDGRHLGADRRRYLYGRRTPPLGLRAAQSPGCSGVFIAVRPSLGAHSDRCLRI